MSIKFLVGLIVSVTIILIMLAATSLIYNMLKEDNPIQMCKASVVRASTISKINFHGKLDGYKSADCPRVELGALDLPKKEPEKKLAKTIADEMRNCWYKFGEGDLNPNKGYPVDQAIACYICSSFEVKEEEKNVDKYLNNYFETLPTKKQYLEKSFVKDKNGNIIYEIVDLDEDASSKKESTEDADVKSSSSNFNLEPGVKYHLVNFFIINQDDKGWWHTWFPLGDFSFISHDTESFMGIVKDENIINTCYTLEN